MKKKIWTSDNTWREESPEETFIRVSKENKFDTKGAELMMGIIRHSTVGLLDQFPILKK